MAKKVTTSTFHALCLRILPSGIDRLGHLQDFRIYGEGDYLGRIKKIISRIAASGDLTLLAR